jgi:hypothetical protein
MGISMRLRCDPARSGGPPCFGFGFGRGIASTLLKARSCAAIARPATIFLPLVDSREGVASQWMSG